MLRSCSFILFSCSHSPLFPSFHLRHSSFWNPSVALPTSQLIFQPFRSFTYVTAHSPTLLSLLLRHRLFTYVRWRAAHGIGRFLSDAFLIDCGRKQWDALPSFLLNFALEYAIRIDQEHSISLELNGKHQLIVYADDLEREQEDPLRSYSLVSVIVCLFVLILVLKFVGND